MWVSYSRNVCFVFAFDALHDWFGMRPEVEGLVWHFHSRRPSTPAAGDQLYYAKLKRTDFGYGWPA